MARGKVVEVSAAAREVVRAISRETGANQKHVVDRVLVWFGEQDEVIQRSILGHYGSYAPDIARLVLERKAGGRNQTSAPPNASVIERKPPAESA